MGEINNQMLQELVEAVRQTLRKEQSDRLRDIYLIGDIEKDTARTAIERLRELANDSPRPITIYINSAGGNVTDGLAIHDAIRHLVSPGIEVTIIVQGMAYSMGSVVLQAASPGTAARVSAFLDHDSRAGEVGGMAVDDGGGAAPRSAQADAEQIYQILAPTARASRCGRSSATPSAPTSTWMRCSAPRLRADRRCPRPAQVLPAENVEPLPSRQRTPSRRSAAISLQLNGRRTGIT